MMTAHDNAVDQYLVALDAALAGVSRCAREGIVDDVQAHIADARDAGRRIPDILDSLGTAQHVAAEARAELGIAEHPAPAETASTALHVAAIVLAVLTAVFVSFLLPSFAIEELGLDGDPTGSTLQTATTMFQAYGLGIALLPLIPAVVAGIPVLLRGRTRSAAGWGAAAVMTVLSMAAGASIGGFFLPLTALLWAAVLVPLWARKGTSPAIERTARIIGGVVIALPMLFGVVTAVIGTFRDPMPPFWIAAALLLAVAALFAFRVRYMDTVVVVVGLGIMTLALLDAGVLTLVVWWIGATWLVAGLCGLVARRAM